MFRQTSFQLFTLALVISAQALLAGCTDDDDDSTTTGTGGTGGAGGTGGTGGQSAVPFAVVSTAASDFSAGAHSLIVGRAPFAATNNLDPSGSDLAIAARGRSIYRMERFMVDTIRKYDASNPGTRIWQFSAKSASEASANPYDLVFVSDIKAYLIRYGSAKAWIVNPSVGVSEEAQFKIGELDLSAYADADGVPEMSAAAVAGGKLFIALQRFENFTTLRDAYVAVFDTATDQEIDTRAAGSAETLKGIKLPVKNPSDIEFLTATGLLYVQGTGKLACGFCQPATPAEFSGGIATISPSTYATAVLVDDGDATAHPFGNIADLALVDATTGYFVGYAAFGDNTLFRFNPTTGAVQTPGVTGFTSKDIGTLGVDGGGLLWVGVSDAQTPGMRILDPVNGDAVVQTVNTALNPIGIAFGEVPAN